MNIIKKVGLFFHFLLSDREVEQKLALYKHERTKLNDRLDLVTRATLNGESDWFLDVVRKDPSCALNVFKECNGNDT